MSFYDDIKKDSEKTLFSTLKVLAIFFSVTPMFQRAYATMRLGATASYASLITMAFALAALCVAILFWTLLNRRGTRHPVYRWIEMGLFYLLFTIAILASGGNQSYYKFIFIFIIVSQAIQFGMNDAMIASGVASALILGVDLAYGDVGQVNTYFENDLALAATFFVIAWTVGFYVRLEQRHIQALNDYANTDGLTQVYNHRYFYQRCEEAFARCTRERRPLSLMIIDLDHFKNYNDIFGHQMGDKLLLDFVDLIKKVKNPEDLIFRYGGDEFCLLLEGRDAKQARELADALRRSVQQHDFEGRCYMPGGEVTVSVGVAELNEHCTTYTKLVDQADASLYRVKNNERNAVEVYEAGSEETEGAPFAANEQSLQPMQPIRLLIALMHLHDEHTYHHVERVVRLCRRVASHMKLSLEQRRMLVYAGYLHDMGMMNIPGEMLRAQRKLTDGEWNMIRMHPQDGAEMIRQIPGFEDVAALALQHHERFDGSGYPHGLKSEEISFLARILAVIDSFDAMTNSRVYQQSIAIEEAIDEMRRERGAQFDPECVDQFIEMLKRE